MAQSVAEQSSGDTSFNQRSYLETEKRSAPRPPWSDFIADRILDSKFLFARSAVASGSAALTNTRNPDGSIAISVETDVAAMDVPRSNHEFDVLFNQRKTAEVKAQTSPQVESLGSDMIVGGIIGQLAISQS